MFGHASLPTVMYRYGAWAPAEELEWVSAQMRRAHRYRNAIVRNELNRRAAVEALLRRLSPEIEDLDRQVAEAEARVASAREAIGHASVRAGKRARPPDLVAAVRAAKEDLAALYRRRKALRHELFSSDSWQREKGAVEEKYKRRSIRLRGASGLHWGTYLHVEQSMSDCRRGAPPRFASWRGDGHVAVQLQKGVTPEEAFSGTDKRIRIDPMPVEGSRAKRKRTVLRLRIGTRDGAPVWTAVPVCLHRPLPADARIKWVHLLRRRIAGNDRWTVSFVLSRAGGWAKPDAAGDGSVSIDVGWRIRPGRALRVAYWRSSDGAEGELCLPPLWLRQYEATYRIQAVRRGLFNRVQSELAGWLKDRPVPAWLAEATATLAFWKSPERLLSVVRTWRGRRFEGDAEMFERMASWRLRELHLWRYEAHRRDRLGAQRRERYRVFAADMRRRYRTARIEELDFRDFHALPQPEEPPPDEIVRRHTRSAALSVLVGVLSDSMAAIERVDPRYTTMRCVRCGHVEDFDRRKLEKLCPACGHAEDQDRGAAVNIGLGNPLPSP